MTTQQRYYGCFLEPNPSLAIWRRKMAVDNQFERRKSMLYLEFLFS